MDYQEPNHAPFLFGCYKFDLAKGTFRTQLWGAEKGRYCAGEPFFVPRRRPGSSGSPVDQDEEAQLAEDDGYLVVLVNDVRRQRTELRVYDAGPEFGVEGEGSGAGATIPAPVATIVCPRRIVPLGTHGIFLAADEIRKP